MELTGEYDIHKRTDRIRNADKNLDEAAISERSRTLIKEFIDSKKKRGEIRSVLREVKYLQKLPKIAELLGRDLDQADKPSLDILRTRIYGYKDKRPGRSGEESIKPITIADYMTITRAFYKWLWKGKAAEVMEDFIPPKITRSRTLPSEILSWEDVVFLSQSGRTPLEIAWPQVLYDCGGRVEEAGTLFIEDVEVIAEGKAIRLHFRRSKTEEGIRSPVIVYSAPALIRYLESHPRRQDPKAPLWASSRGKPLTYAALRKILIRLKERSGLKKPCNPHNFRKSAATSYSHNPNFNILEIKQRFGWTKSSRMLDVYCRIDESKVNDKVLEEAGLKQREKVQDELKESVCGWCKKPNPLGARFCVVCLRPLNLRPDEAQTVIEWEGVNRRILDKLLEEEPEIGKSVRKAFNKTKT